MPKSVLLAIFSIIFLEFLVMGIALGVLPAFVHNLLAYSNAIVGTVIGAQYLATLATRHLAGKLADTRGGNLSVAPSLPWPASVWRPGIP